jgi:hypothetical protein
MPLVKLALLLVGIGSIVTGIAMLSLSVACIVGGAMMLGLLWLISLAEVKK